MSDERLEEIAQQPKSVESDGQKVENHSLSEQIELDRYLASKAATSSSSKGRGFRITKMKAGGAV